VAVGPVAAGALWGGGWQDKLPVTPLCFPDQQDVRVEVADCAGILNWSDLARLHVLLNILPDAVRLMGIDYEGMLRVVSCDAGLACHDMSMGLMCVYTFVWASYLVLPAP